MLVVIAGAHGQVARLLTRRLVARGDAVRGIVRNGAVKLLGAGRARDVGRFVIVSSVGAEAPPAGDDVFAVYLRAKAEADAAVAASDRAWTIVRPGRLTDDPGTGRVRLTLEPQRADVP